MGKKKDKKEKDNKKSGKGRKGGKALNKGNKGGKGKEHNKGGKGGKKGKSNKGQQGRIKGSPATEGRGDKVNGFPCRNCHPEEIWGRGGCGRRKPQDCHFYFHSWTPSVGGVQDVWRRKGKNCSDSKGLNRRDVRYHGA